MYTHDRGARRESAEHTIELTKEFRALKIWFTIKHFGAKRLTEFIRHDIEMINYLGQKLSELEYIEIEKEHPLSIICFRWNDPKLTKEQNELVNTNALRLIEK